METTMTREPMEFRDREMFLRCIDGYTAQLYRYQ